jgi:hypothetical protein
MWAFPYGFDDAFYYGHQWVDLLPKRLRHASGEELPDVIVDREYWLRSVRRRYPLRHFWYEGDLYCHVAPNGDVLGGDEWVRMDAIRFAELLIARGIDKVEYRGASGPRARDRDFLEVFLPRRARTSPPR